MFANASKNHQTQNSTNKVVVSRAVDDILPTSSLPLSLSLSHTQTHAHTHIGHIKAPCFVE